MSSPLSDEQTQRLLSELVQNSDGDGLTQERLAHACRQMEELAVDAALWTMWQSGTAIVRLNSDGELAWALAGWDGET